MIRLGPGNRADLLALARRLFLADPHLPAGTTAAAADRFFSDYHLVGFWDGATLAGVLQLGKGQIHVYIEQAYRRRWASRGLRADVLRLARATGCVKTCAAADDRTAASLLSFAGFSQTRRRGAWIDYQLSPRALNARILSATA